MVPGTRCTGFLVHRKRQKMWHLLLWVISGSDQGVGAVFYSLMSTVQTSRYHVKIGNVTVSAEYSTNVGRKLSKYSELI